MPAKKQDFGYKTCLECGSIIIHKKTDTYGGKMKKIIKNNKPEVGYSSEE